MSKTAIRSAVLLATFACSAAAYSGGNNAYKPNPTELRDAYKRADAIRDLYTGKALNVGLTPHWYAGNQKLWFQSDGLNGVRHYLTVSESGGDPQPLFDHKRLAQTLTMKLGKPADPDKLGLADLRVEGQGESIAFNIAGKGYTCDLGTYAVADGPLVSPQRPRREPPWTQDLWPADTNPVASPDGEWTARSDGTNVVIKPKDGQEFTITNNGSPSGYFFRVEWRADSKKLLAFRVQPGDRKPVYLIQSSPPGGGRAVLKQRVYDLPGDKTDAFDVWTLDPSTKEVKRVDADPVDYGDLANVRWSNDRKHFTWEKMDRGFQRWRLMEGDSETGSARALIDEQSKTFVDSTSQYMHICDTGEIVYRSERDGWGHLYLYSPDGTLKNRITEGKWVVRGVDRVDDKGRQIVFHASGINAGEDPYFNQYYKVNFDGTGMKPLTPEPGDHVATFSPDGTTLIDTFSTVVNPPVHTLRKVSDGSLLSTLSKADISQLVKSGWRAPEVFVAKARDGATDIWGVVYRPSNFSPRRSYPIIEDIYAGPQDSFTPKSFAAYRGDQALAELGFIVVQMDGMGTRNRGKAFQDVCWHNIADAGFPDRILWMKALAKKYPYMDIDRVGVFGTSAGGQNSTTAMLSHPEFYKVAVSSCGCQDNRMDKLWWNEQWMGYPVGPWYEDQSNITNAGKLKGKLMLFVGELDTNVPPESTLRLVNALMVARKEFDMLVIPNSDHTNGGPYGERKRRDFFVHNLLGVEPPEWNAETDPPGGTPSVRRGA